MTDSPSIADSRQKVRKALLIISFLLIPVTLFYISPIVIMMGASEGIATGSMLLFILLFILSFVIGRFWCGWLCPMGAWQELCSPLIRRTVPEGRINLIKYGIMILWLAMLAATFLSAGGIHAVDPFYGTVNGISITSLDVLVIAGIIFLFIIVVSFITGKRGFCHLLCPIAGMINIGRRIRNLFGWPALQLQSTANLCIDCNKCRETCPMGLDVHRMVRQDTMENQDCILCAHCADVCPKGAIRFGFGKRERNS